MRTRTEIEREFELNFGGGYTQKVYHKLFLEVLLDIRELLRK